MCIVKNVGILKMLKLETDPNLVVFGFHYKSLSLVAELWQLFCDFWLWLPSKMADNMFKLKTNLARAQFNPMSH